MRETVGSQTALYHKCDEFPPLQFEEPEAEAWLFVTVTALQLQSSGSQLVGRDPFGGEWLFHRGCSIRKVVD